MRAGKTRFGKSRLKECFSRALCICLIAAAAMAAAFASACSGGYEDGTYTGVGEGQSGEISVTLTISEGTITVDEITDPGEIAGLGGAEAIEDGTYKEQIEAAQSWDIEGVESAPLTNEGVSEAVKDALDQAK